MMIERFLKYLNAEKRYSLLTQKAYSQDLQDFSAYLREEYGMEDILQTDFNQIRSYVIRLSEQKYSPASIHRKISSLKSFFKYCLKSGVLATNPALGVPLPKMSKRLPVFVEKSKMENILQRPVDTDDFIDYRNYLIIELFYGAGLRLSELLNLKSDWVYLEEGQLKVLGKRDKERVIPIPKGLAEEMRQYCRLKAISPNSCIASSRVKESFLPSAFSFVIKSLSFSPSKETFPFSCWMHISITAGIQTS